jgi:Beta xylosidase C-terminal Concanavalin A-like domain
VAAEPVQAADIFLRTELDFDKRRGVCSYSLDEKHWTTLGGEFDLTFDWRTGTFQGEQFAIFCFNPQPGEGFVDVGSFTFTDKKE